MRADTVSAEELVAVCETIRPGETCELATALYDYKNPLEVVETRVTEWLNPNGNWKTARLELLGNNGGEHTITAVEGSQLARDFISKGSHLVHRVGPAGGRVEKPFWCARCGKGPMTEEGVKRHNGHVHDGGPIIWDVEPDEDALVGDGEPTDELSEETVEMFGEPEREPAPSGRTVRPGPEGFRDWQNKPQRERERLRREAEK